MSEPIRVMIVDDHDMVRLGLRTYLLTVDDMKVVSEAVHGQDALDKLALLSQEGQLPQLVLMDLTMPVMDGVAATANIREKYPEIKIVILTSFLEDDKVVSAIEAGASTYALKTATSDELITVLRGASRGMQVMNTEVSQALSRGLRQRSNTDDKDGLTQREKEVLLLIADGYSNKDIADELHISIKTVKTHVSNLLMKCEQEDRTQLAIYAHRKGWT